MLLDKLKNYKIILASTSPRRKQLLDGLGFHYTVEVPSDVAEITPDNLSLEEVPAYLSEIKSGAFGRDLTAEELLITADTVVICNNQLLVFQTAAAAVAAVAAAAVDRSQQLT